MEIRIELLNKLRSAYMDTYQKVMSNYSNEEQIEFTNALIRYNDYFLNKENDYTPITKLFNFLAEKYRNRYSPFKFAGFQNFYDKELALTIKGIIEKKQTLTTEDFLTEEEFESFLGFVNHFLNVKKEYLLLEEPTENTLNGNKTANGKTIIINLPKVKREKNDSLTALNQEETALLAYYLQNNRVIIKDNVWVPNKAIASAFSILTGFSENTLRMNLSNFPAKLDSVPKERFRKILSLIKSIEKQIEKDLNN